MAPPTHVNGIDDGVGYGVQGDSQTGFGVVGTSQTSFGVQGSVGIPPKVFVPSLLPAQAGVFGKSYQPSMYGVIGSGGNVGVYGVGAIGVRGNDGTGQGPAADRPAGIFGDSAENYGVLGSSADYDGVKGMSNSNAHAGVSGINTAQQTGQVPSGYGIWAFSTNTGIFAQGNPAGYFVGDVQVTGDLILINSPASGDVAEDFDLEEDPAHAEPGTVLIINSEGKLCASSDPYDTRVAGVVSGAGALRPAVVLQRIRSATPRSPVALLGKAFCKVDAAFGSIVAGDLLTTSPTLGHAMKVTDRPKSIGAILGKALGSRQSGCGLIPILVSVR